MASRYEDSQFRGGGALPKLAMVSIGYGGAQCGRVPPDTGLLRRFLPWRA